MTPMRARVRVIVSGGQTGADRAALDWAIAHRLPHGGWCPAGRRAEDGRIPRRYRLRETPSADYGQRTRWNVRDSDATVILARASVLAGGSRLTARHAARLGKPWIHLRPDRDDPARLAEFVARHRVCVLNVAGPRASKDPGIYAAVRAFLERSGLAPKTSRP